MKIFFFHLLTLIALVGCMPGSSNLQIKMPKKGATVSSSVSTASISSVQVINNQLVINGNGFTDVTTVKVNGNSLNENFSIESKTATKIIANSIRAFSFDVSKVFSLILSDANASATFAIDFSLCNATLNGKGFNCAAPVADKDVLAYDAVSGTWKPRPASGLNYLGTFDASSNPGAGPAIQPAGAYYVISDDGTIAAVSFAVGDWLVSNGTTWQKIDNSSAVLSVHGRYGAITAQQGDYTLALLGDVSFPTAPVAGKVLKFDGTNWVASDDLSGGGAGSVTTTAIAAGAVTDAKIDTVSAIKITGTLTSAQITDGTIVNADINAAAGIDYSKLNIPNTTIPYAKLNIADGAIPASKISGIPAVTSVLSTSITNGDTTHAPNSDAVYDALILKLGVNGGALTSGTISGLPTPVGPTEAANKSYVDSEIAGITGFSEAGVLATDLLGLNTGVNGPISATDTVLGAFGKMQYQVTDLKAKGQWDKTVNDIAYTAGNVSIDKKLRLKSDNANYVEILSPTSLASTYTLTLPPNDGNADQVLKTNGTGTLSWVDLTDANVQAFAKTALPTCAAGEVLKSNGTSFSCVTDTSVPAFTGTANRAVATTGAGGSLAVQAVTSTELGYLSGVTSAIQTQLNGKEGTLTAGTSAQYYRGDKSWATLNTAGVPELTNLYFTQARAIASPLTGVSSTAGTITAADTILGAFGKLLNTQTDYVSKTANSTITGTLTINSIVGALKVPSPVNVDDAVPKSYVDGFGQWLIDTTNIYRSAGNVGLGTSTPDRRLTIIGDGTNYGDDVWFEGTNSETAVPQINLVRSRGTLAARTPVLTNDIIGSVAFRGNDVNGGTAFPYASRIDSRAETDFGTAINGNITFLTNSAGTLAEKMRITSAGNVGIGTSSPTQQLSVVGNISVTGEVTSKDFFQKTVTIADGWAVGDYVEIVQALPGGAGASSNWEIHLSGTRNSWAEGTTYIISGVHAGVANWRELPHTSESGYIGGGKCFTVDTHPNSNSPKFRIRAIKASAACGAAGNPLPLNFRIRSIGSNSSWTNLSATGTGATVVGMQSMGLSWNVYTGNPQNNGVLALHANALGNIGIGTASPSSKLHISSAAGGVTSTIERPAGSFGLLQLATTGSGRRWELGADNAAESGSDAGSNLGLWAYGDGGAQTQILSVSRSSGNVGMGTTGPGAKLDINGGTAGTAVNLILNTASVGAHNYLFFKANGTIIGSVTSAAGANVAYNTTSDVRLKGGFTPISGALEKVNQIEVSNFYYLADPKARMDGFKAQQLYSVVPYAVTRPETEVDKKGKINPWLADYSKVVPLITGAVQEVSQWLSRHDREIASLKEENKMLKSALCKKDPDLEFCK